MIRSFYPVNKKESLLNKKNSCHKEKKSALSLNNANAAAVNSIALYVQMRINLRNKQMLFRSKISPNSKLKN